MIFKRKTEKEKILNEIKQREIDNSALKKAVSQYKWDRLKLPPSKRGDVNPLSHYFFKNLEEKNVPLSRLLMGVDPTMDMGDAKRIIKRNEDDIKFYKRKLRKVI
jgi:hypothetical protein